MYIHKNIIIGNSKQTKQHSTLVCEYDCEEYVLCICTYIDYHTFAGDVLPAISSMLGLDTSTLESLTANTASQDTPSSSLPIPTISLPTCTSTTAEHNNTHNTSSITRSEAISTTTTSKGQ